ncbi:MAG: PrsW family glutamic-type intramembrane protease [Usitatibacter sp.]
MAAALMGLAPVAIFLAALLFLDSYKLVRLPAVMAVVAAGMAAAGAAFFATGLLPASLDFAIVTRYVAPVMEESLKALVIVALVRMHRIGFLIDAAIFGFAVGTGFAIVENLQYLRLVPDAGLGTWLVRGLGTALMHGGTTAAFALIAVAQLERKAYRGIAAGLLLAVAIHSVYNHFFLSPFFSTAGIAIALPLILNAVFAHSDTAVGDWLGKGFDADAAMLDLIHSGNLSDSPAGRYLHDIKERFDGPVVADLLCYLRLYTELAMRAKGVLMMREGGFDAPVDEATREKFTELRYLEKSIGRTGLAALKPMLHMSHKELWQLYMIGK